LQHGITSGGKSPDGGIVIEGTVRLLAKIPGSVGTGTLKEIQDV
jgi:hypothetical protein